MCFDLVAYALISRESLSDAQKNDPTLEKCCVSAENNVSPSLQQFDWNDGMLMSKWGRSLNAEQADQRNVVHQILIPLKFRLHVLSLAHDHPWSGHLGINKIYNRVLQHLFWPGLKTDCHICQVRGKPNQVYLCPISGVSEPVERVLVDCVGPLPRTNLVASIY